MKAYVFLYNEKLYTIDISYNGSLEYRWPAVGQYRNFTLHLLSRVLSKDAILRLLTKRLPVLALVYPSAFDIYMPPEYRRVPQKKSLWIRFINLFKGESPCTD